MRKLKLKAAYLEPQTTDMETLAPETRPFHLSFTSRPLWPTLSLVMGCISIVGFTLKRAQVQLGPRAHPHTCWWQCGPGSRQCHQLLFIFALLMVNSFFPQVCKQVKAKAKFHSYRVLRSQNTLESRYTETWALSGPRRPSL